MQSSSRQEQHQAKAAREYKLVQGFTDHGDLLHFTHDKLEAAVRDVKDVQDIVYNGNSQAPHVEEGVSQTDRICPISPVHGHHLNRVEAEQAKHRGTERVCEWNRDEDGLSTEGVADSGHDVSREFGLVLT